MLKIISLGSADEQCIYASTWFRIINVCAQELKYGVSIWKRASEKNVQHQILSDSRGRMLMSHGSVFYCYLSYLILLNVKIYKKYE